MKCKFALKINNPEELEFIDKSGNLLLAKYKNCRANKALLDFLKKNFNNIRIQTIYFGDEFCEFKTPKVDQLKLILNRIKASSLNFNYLTSYLTLNNEAQIKNNLQYLNTVKKSVSVTINDFSLFSYLVRNKIKIPIIIGRLLLRRKNYSDHKQLIPDMPPWLNSDLNIIKSNQEYFFYNLPYLEFFKNPYNKKLIIEIDQLELLKFLDKNQLKLVNLHLPWSYLTSGRNCLIAHYFDKKYSFPVRKCQYQCRDYFYLFKNDNNLVQYGNAVFKNNLKINYSIKKMGYLNNVILDLINI